MRTLDLVHGRAQQETSRAMMRVLVFTYPGANHVAYSHHVGGVGTPGSSVI